ncbi:MAG TPA: DUF4382 domain-containing protein [Steroidobacteraceae bacterium]|nr:DUF4382 domain-containing protein [Steroidobacteraceae bacterium]
MVPNASRLLTVGVAAALLAACGGGGSSGSTSTPMMPASQTGNVSMLVSDASTEDWATIGVKVLSIALVPQGGGSNVTVYTAPAAAPMVNLAELDQIAEILGNASVPVGTYTGAVLTVSANAGDVVLTVAADPETGFIAAPGTTVPAAQIQVQHAQGASPNLTVPVTVTFDSPLVVSASQNNALDLEFDLGHPAFIVGHVPPGVGQTLWAVNFEGPVRHRPLHELSRLVLRHLYGDVTSVATGSITVTKEFPTVPAVNPETAVASNQSLQILADATNGTILYDVDAKTRTVIKDFSAESSLSGKSVRIAARYQEDGTLVATRIWASSQFNNVWLSPEGHVLHVDINNNVVVVETESGGALPVTVDANTQFFFREPQDPAADSMPIGTGPAFLASHDLVRGFKVHASVVDPTASPMVAQSIDIETAVYDGKISAADSTGFTLTRMFRTPTDDYVKALDYIANATPNGTDDAGNAVTGFKWWNFAYPTLLDSGANATTDFVSATTGSVDFGGSVGPVASRGISFATWNDPANPNGWAATAAILTPSLLPLGFVSTGLVNDAFTMTVTGGANPATVDVGTASGSATLVYQVDCTGGVVTISAIDVTTSAGLASLTSGLAAGTPVKVYGVPQADGTLKAYVLAYFTGQAPAAID